ncbi:hypothetical protein AXF42_Ash010534 [Apostasia shenzhenica]|uniref:Uncharacterized protein n=1 Tax=Apostasia shenzhenica TaxID=1088818 RepID=A0A2I0A6D7_9ASPA|nr:hypothetical protein AXF42_Ash010534 [Apostasia shenzhenica]
MRFVIHFDHLSVHSGRVNAEDSIDRPCRWGIGPRRLTRTWRLQILGRSPRVCWGLALLRDIECGRHQREFFKFALAC